MGKSLEPSVRMQSIRPISYYMVITEFRQPGFKKMLPWHSQIGGICAGPPARLSDGATPICYGRRAGHNRARGRSSRAKSRDINRSARAAGWPGRKSGERRAVIVLRVIGWLLIVAALLALGWDIFFCIH